MTWGSDGAGRLAKRRPIEIPETSPERYITGFTALNLREPDELTGDWHYEVLFYGPADQPAKVPKVAGEGGVVDSRPALGRRGVRNMGAELVRKRIIPAERPVYFANHNRAIADLVLSTVQSPGRAVRVAPSEINQWLDTEDQVKDLVRNYLRPLAGILSEEERAVFLTWLKTVRYE